MANAEVVIPPDTDRTGVEQQPACLVESPIHFSDVAENNDLIDTLTLESAQSDPQPLDVFVNIGEETDSHWPSKSAVRIIMA